MGGEEDPDKSMNTMEEGRSRATNQVAKALVMILVITDHILEQQTGRRTECFVTRSQRIKIV